MISNVSKLHVFLFLFIPVSCITSPDVYLASQLRKHKLPSDPLFINILVLRSEVRLMYM